ncbi:DUF5339 domain-containing protein [Pasteurella multocida]|uniref:DUF5339 domain-containing protein n=1 Tax=Pasteurella multocida TaxID=747 RepID=UPI0002144724|nr:DUF5339 domain-containing protein [Pasteurella multocida]EGP04863.1 hypothetical protein AAUPMG_05999 [Pasteurella multocida subsp. multocida str. Anand1_goat]ATF75571.1 recombinase XerD [Pasteurella multocida]ATN17972.1 recombinase XerD [Pasteurella multocida]AWB52185.1 recombinase XerD [Pasteurella multocida]HDR1030865.1 DUF5339 domain-containing protein [Pasteurella multocida]
MKRRFSFILTALFAASALVTSPVHASKPTEIKTNTNAAVPQQCEKLFKETEDLIAEAEKQPGTHTQVNKIKSKLNQSKQQILEMELATQIKSCDFALTKLNTLKQQ